MTFFGLSFCFPAESMPRQRTTPRVAAERRFLAAGSELRGMLCAIFLSLLATPVQLVVSRAQMPSVDYLREVQPIFAEHCLHCHGADATTRHGGVRLDNREAALSGGDSGQAAIVAGKSLESHLMQRVLSQDADEMMPPPEENKPLSPQQIETLRRWIDEGAEYAEHWAFTAPRAQPLPENGPPHSVDQWVLRQLQLRQLQLAPREEDAILCRRLYLDIIGIPPSPAELAAFHRDGYAATVERLLGSERYGEKWARHWLDVARYSDTNGYEKDLRRDQWAWRDWVVSALNQDMPYDQFLIEQLAGDLLPEATQSQQIATGFLRNSMLNEEGAIIPEQFRMFEMFDRMDCVGKAVLGLTTQCAQCHTHKFDPLTHDEYYGMLAFINNAYEAQTWVYTPEQLQQRAQALKAVEAVYARVRKERPQWRSELAAWAEVVKSQQGNWTPVDMHQLESISGLNHPVQLQDKSILMLGHTSGDAFFVGSPDLQGITGVRLEILVHEDLPFSGPGRSPVGTWDISEIEVFVRPAGSTEWQKQTLVEATADFSEADQKIDEEKSSGPVAYLIDGTDGKVWQADRGVGRRNQPSVAVVRFEKPLEFPAESQFKFVMRMGKMVGCCRVSLTRDAEPAAAAVDYAAVLALSDLDAPKEGGSDAAQPLEEQAQIFAAWCASLGDMPQLAEELKQAWSQFPTAQTSVLSLKERHGEHRRQTRKLNRGEWDQPREVIAAHTPAFLHPLEGEAEEPTRLDFARWLASERSPLTARVAVNRVWQAMFGEGLVETAEDLGTRAPVPQQLDLLDWLSLEFMRQGWSQKQLIRTIVSSQTYQQSSRVSDTQREVDPRNRWLARGPRFRCEAEGVRDIALAASGLITQRLGGPSVIPPVPQNVLDYNYVYPGYWTPATGPERYRRSVYIFRKRSMPDPVMSNLDAPNGDIACARRVRSNTPLAALTGLNEPVFVEAAQALALRVLREGGVNDEARIDYGYLLCTSRLPTAEERSALLGFLMVSRQRIADGWVNAREIATGDQAKLPALPEGTTPQDAAAWTLASRILLNLDETISKN
jgi:mono/diheme cytochrome c family protein